MILYYLVDLDCQKIFLTNYLNINKPLLNGFGNFTVLKLVASLLMKWYIILSLLRFLHLLLPSFPLPLPIFSPPLPFYYSFVAPAPSRTRGGVFFFFGSLLLFF